MTEIWVPVINLYELADDDPRKVKFYWDRDSKRFYHPDIPADVPFKQDDGLPFDMHPKSATFGKPLCSYMLVIIKDDEDVPKCTSAMPEENVPLHDRLTVSLWRYCRNRRYERAEAFFEQYREKIAASVAVKKTVAEVMVHAFRRMEPEVGTTAAASKLLAIADSLGISDVDIGMDGAT